MKQATMAAPYKIVYSDVPVPKISDDQILVKIKRIGICGSDIHVYHGKHPYTTYPVVQGHELAGEVAETGTKVQGFKKGDKVTIIPQVVCGTCYHCKNDRYNICENLKVYGFQTDGVGCEYFAAPADLVFKTESIADLDAIAMVEPVAVAVHAVKRLGDVSGKKIFVIGAGPIGNLIAQTAKALGASEVMIADISDFRLEMASKCGIDYCINTKTEDIGKALTRHFGPDKADAILECAGVDATMEAAITHARKGTDIVVVAVFAQKATVDLGLVQDRELRLIGTLMYKKDDFQTAIELIGSKKINVSILVTDHFKFDEFPKAYEYIEAQKDKVMKVVVTMD
jgi:L-iditol 2-dehydrogenase